MTAIRATKPIGIAVAKAHLVFSTEWGAVAAAGQSSTQVRHVSLRPEVRPSGQGPELASARSGQRRDPQAKGFFFREGERVWSA